MTNRKKRCIKPQIIKTPIEKQAMAEASKPSTFLATNSRIFFPVALP